MLDYRSLLYGPIYDRLGVPATIVTQGGATIELTVRNLTAPSTISGIGVDFQAFKPSAIARLYELEGADLAEDVVGGELTMDAHTWSIKSFEYVASPNGNSDGEVRLILKDDLDV